MSAVTILKNAGTSKPFMSFKDLEVGEYAVEKFDLLETTYGVRIRIQLKDCFLFLPQRYAEAIGETEIKDLNLSSVIMTYAGKDPINQNRLMLDFNVQE